MTRDARPAAMVALALLLAASPATASMEKAQAARARGDLRAAQIELRNAVRAKPDDAALRVALAISSIDMGDSDTAEKEARAALERGYDRAAGTELLASAYLVGGRYQNLLRGIPIPDAATPPAVAGQALAARAAAYIGLNQIDEARQAAEAAMKLSPDAPTVNLALASVAAASGDRNAAEAAVERVLAIAPDNLEGLQRRGTMLFQRGQFASAIAAFDRILAQAPTNLPARLSRAESRIRLGDFPGARSDVDTVSRSYPGSVPGIYLDAYLLAQGGNALAADQALQRIARQLPDMRDGLLLLATTKRALGQKEVAEDAARRYVARRPDDPRGAKVLAALEMDAGRPAAAMATLGRLAALKAADAEAYDMLGHVSMAAHDPREAEAAFAQAVRLDPQNAALQSRLAIARFAIGDLPGMASAARESLRLSPSGTAAHQLLAIDALARGDLSTAEAELGKLPPAEQTGEIASVLQGTIRSIRLDLTGAREVFEAALRANPRSPAANLGLARVAAAQGRGEEADRLASAALQADPNNAEATGRLVSQALSGGPRSAAARTALRDVQAASPGRQQLTLAYANVLMRLNEAGAAATLLEAEVARGSAPSAPILMALAEMRVMLEDLDKAEAAARAALGADPTSSAARRQLAIILARRGDTQGADTLLESGLRDHPGDATLQAGAIALAQQTGGLEGALAAADRLAQRPGAMPQAASLRGDLLMAARRHEDAAKAYAAAYKVAPSSIVAMRLAEAQLALRKPQDAGATLDIWLAREPDDMVALSARGVLDLQVGRDAEAERRFAQVVEKTPLNVVALNNLAWLLQKKNQADALKRAGLLAERAYFLSPTLEIADTLGWIKVRSGDAAAGLPLLRLAMHASAVGKPTADPAISYRLARALSDTGARAEAIQVLEQSVKGQAAFAERADAERLLAELRVQR